MFAKPLFVAEHSCHARGLLGRIVAKLMALDTAPENRKAIELLDVSGAKRILDFGCGHGRWLSVLAKQAPKAQVVGADMSATMIKEAISRNRQHVHADRVQVHKTLGLPLPYQDSRFDRILSVHTLYFLHPLEEYLADLQRILEPGGKMVMGFRPEGADCCKLSFPCEVYRMRSSEEVTRLAEAAGLTLVEAHTETVSGHPMCWLVLEK